MMMIFTLVTAAQGKLNEIGDQINIREKKKGNQKQNTPKSNYFMALLLQVRIS